MSDDEFRVIGEKQVGVLDDTLRQEWDRLSVRQLKILHLQTEHDEALDAFIDALQRRFGTHVGAHETSPKYRVSPDGVVFAEFCKCPVCQANLHGLTVVETVEQMYKKDLIPHEVIAHMRRKARVVDSRQAVSKKLLN
jgi:hypothetical protein